MVYRVTPRQRIREPKQPTFGESFRAAAGQALGGGLASIPGALIKGAATNLFQEGGALERAMTPEDTLQARAMKQVASTDLLKAQAEQARGSAASSLSNVGRNEAMGENYLATAAAQRADTGMLERRESRADVTAATALREVFDKGSAKAMELQLEAERLGLDRDRVGLLKQKYSDQMKLAFARANRRGGSLSIDKAMAMAKKAHDTYAKAQKSLTDAMNSGKIIIDSNGMAVTKFNNLKGACDVRNRAYKMVLGTQGYIEERSKGAVKTYAETIRSDQGNLPAPGTTSVSTGGTTPSVYINRNKQERIAAIDADSVQTDKLKTQAQTALANAKAAQVKAKTISDTKAAKLAEDKAKREEAKALRDIEAHKDRLKTNKLKRKKLKEEMRNSRINMGF